MLFTAQCNIQAQCSLGQWQHNTSCCYNSSGSVHVSVLKVTSYIVLQYDAPMCWSSSIIAAAVLLFTGPPVKLVFNAQYERVFIPQPA